MLPGCCVEGVASAPHLIQRDTAELGSAGTTLQSGLGAEDSVYVLLC